MCKAFVLVLSDVMVPTVALLGRAQLSNDPSPSYCTTGFCTSNKWHFFPWLYMELNELSKIATQHRPLLACPHMSQKVEGEQLRRLLSKAPRPANSLLHCGLCQLPARLCPCTFADQQGAAR